MLILQTTEGQNLLILKHLTMIHVIQQIIFLPTIDGCIDLKFLFKEFRFLLCQGKLTIFLILIDMNKRMIDKR